MVDATVVGETEVATDDDVDTEAVDVVGVTTDAVESEVHEAASTATATQRPAPTENCDLVACLTVGTVLPETVSGSSFSGARASENRRGAHHEVAHQLDREPIAVERQVVVRGQFLANVVEGLQVRRPLGVAVGDWNNDGFPDVLITCVGQNRLFRNTGKGTFVDVTQASGLGGRTAFSTSALWVDFDRDGFLDLFVCNYVKWSADHDVFCSLDGKQKSYCTPEAYRGDTCWLFRNRGNGTFEDVTATSGVFDTSSKSLGVAMLDYDGDGWPDLFVANDTQPNKLYRNMKNGTFKDVAVEAGLAFSADGKARAGMGVDTGDFDNSGHPGLAITNFDNEMIGLYKATRPGIYEDVAMRAGIGAPSRNNLGFGCVLADIDLDGALDLIVVNGHINDTVRNIRGNVGYAQAPQLFLNQRNGTFRDVAAEVGSDFARPRVGRGLAYGDFDRDGDLDLLVTTNNGQASLFRNDQVAGNRSVRFHLVGTKSNRDAIGAVVRIFHGGTSQSRMVKSGSSYLSQSELPVTFGVGKRDLVERVVIAWPSGRTEEFKNVACGKSYECIEGQGLK